LSTPPPPIADQNRAAGRWWLVLLAGLAPWLVGVQVLLRGDLLVPPAAIEAFHAVVLQHVALATGWQPVLWDPASILGGYPLYAASQGGVWYPGHLLLLLIPDPATAWNLTLLLHLSAAAMLGAALATRLGWGVLPSLILALVCGASPDAFYAAQVPAVVWGMPWLLWMLLADLDPSRPAPLRIAHWGLGIGLATLADPLSGLLVVLAALARCLAEKGWMLMLSVGVGWSLAALQLLPYLLQTESQQWSDVAWSFLCALRPIGALAVLLCLPGVMHRTWLLLTLLGLIAIGYGWVDALGWLLGLAVVLWWADQPAAARFPWLGHLRWTLVPLLLLWGCAMVPVVSIAPAEIREMVNQGRGLYPRETHPSIAILATPWRDRPTAAPVGRYDRPLNWRDYSGTAAWPLLWNLAPDRDLAAAAVALPWHQEWQSALDALTERQQSVEGQRLATLIEFEFLAQGLGLNAFAGRHPNVPYLDYRPLDPAHPGRPPAPPAAEEAERDALEAAVMEQIALPGETPPEVPAVPPAFEQQQVLGLAWYQARGNVPFAIFGERPDTPLSLPPATWTTLRLEALKQLQASTSYPYGGPLERHRFVVLADNTPDGQVRSPATLVVDRGRALAATPVMQRSPHTLTLRLQVPATDAPWLILRQSLTTGWRTTVNGQSVPIARADGVWMAIPLTGEEAALVELLYEVPGYRLGRWISLVAFGGWLLLGIVGMRSGGRLSSVASPGPKDADAAES